MSPVLFAQAKRYTINAKRTEKKKKEQVAGYKNDAIDKVMLFEEPKLVDIITPLSTTPLFPLSTTNVSKKKTPHPVLMSLWRPISHSEMFVWRQQRLCLLIGWRFLITCRSGSRQRNAIWISGFQGRKDDLNVNRLPVHCCLDCWLLSFACRF